MKKVLQTAGLAVVLALVGTGCSGTEEAPVASPEPSVSSEASAPSDESVASPSPSESVVIEDETYLYLIKKYGSAEFFKVLPDEELILVGRSICEELDSGTPVEEFVASLDYDLGGVMSQEDIDLLLGISIGAYCPEYYPDLEGVTNDEEVSHV